MPKLKLTYFDIHGGYVSGSDILSSSLPEL